jgi:cytochrome c-type biogenesis protein CcmF
MLSLGALGSAGVMLALALSLYAAIAGAVGAHGATRACRPARASRDRRVPGPHHRDRGHEAALLTDDFSVKYVAEHSRIASPTWVKVVTMWAALEGLGAAVGLAADRLHRRARRHRAEHRAAALGAGRSCTSCRSSSSVVAFAANPFIVLANPPLDGPGANPLLQNHWMMAVHPVLMYLGFVGLTVPFAFAMAALITKRPGTEWMRLTRRWTLAGWGFLTAAIISGGWWSYEVLGWGGYWAWDPVENVSIMPWLTATAFIHSVQVQERRRMLKAWNLLLIVLTFSLTLLGTFLIRSGVISSCTPSATARSARSSWPSS